MKKSTTILVIVLVAVVFGGVGYWFGTKQVENKNVAATTTPTVTATASTVASATTTADPTASWKTYTNDKYGFSFKYPSDWKYTTSSTDRDPLQVTISTQETINSEANPSTVITLTGDSADTVVSTDESRYSTTANYGKSNSTFADQPATLIQYSSSERNNTNINKIVVFSKNNLTYVLSGITKDNLYSGNQSRAEFDQILSTFKFTK